MKSQIQRPPKTTNQLVPTMAFGPTLAATKESSPECITRTGIAAAYVSGTTNHAQNAPNIYNITACSLSGFRGKFTAERL